MNGRNQNCELFNAFEKGMTACTCLKKNTTFENTTSLQVPSYNNDGTTQKQLLRQVITTLKKQGTLKSRDSEKVASLKSSISTAFCVAT